VIVTVSAAFLVTIPAAGAAESKPPAQAGETVASDSSGSFLLTLVPDDTTISAATVTLSCGPDGGDHPADVAAICRQLTAVDGHIGLIPEAVPFCSKESFPLMARAQGQWNGEQRRFEADYGNGCLAKAATGGYVFDFWRFG